MLVTGSPTGLRFLFTVCCLNRLFPLRIEWPPPSFKCCHRSVGCSCFQRVFFSRQNCMHFFVGQRSETFRWSSRLAALLVYIRL